MYIQRIPYTSCNNLLYSIRSIPTPFNWQSRAIEKFTGKQPFKSRHLYYYLILTFLMKLKPIFSLNHILQASNAPQTPRIPKEKSTYLLFSCFSHLWIFPLCLSDVCFHIFYFYARWFNEIITQVTLANHLKEI